MDSRLLCNPEKSEENYVSSAVQYVYAEKICMLGMLHKLERHVVNDLRLLWEMSCPV